MIPVDFSNATDWQPLANHLWQSTLCVGVVWLLSLALRKNRAAIRYWVWFAASAKFLLPFAPFVALGAKFASRTAPAIAQPQWSFAVDNVIQPFATSAIAPHAATPHAALGMGAILLGTWLCGVAVGIAAWLRCWLQMRKVHQQARPLDLALPIPAVSSPSQIEPGVFGIFRPALLLPEGIENRLTPEQMEAVLAHEMCHVRRRDNLTAAIHMLTETVFWFHPLIWWIRMCLIEERERACDEEVLQRGSEAETYAAGIIEVCKSYVESPLACVSGISGSDLKKRILRIVTNRLGNNLTFARKLLLVVICSAAVLGPLIFGLVNAPLIHAQSPGADWEKAAGGKMLFDVASVKRNLITDNHDAVHSNVRLDSGYGFAPTGGLFSASDFPLIAYVGFAYKLTLNQQLSVYSQLPKWASQDRYDVEARAAGNPTKDQYRLMMQALLADRFKLAVHFETKTAPIFALVLDKPGKLGSQLRRHADDVPCAVSAIDRGPGPTVAGGFPAACGGIVRLETTAPGRIRIGARDVPVSALTDILSGKGLINSDKPIVDKTALGNVDFVVEFSPGAGPGTSDVAPSATSESDPNGPTILEALKDQLGLRMDSTAAPVDFVVVDHIEEPSAN